MDKAQEHCEEGCLDDIDTGCTCGKLCPCDDCIERRFNDDEYCSFW